MKTPFRLIFVDDEPWALIGLRDIIDWEAYGFEVCALCESAEEAVEVLRGGQIDAICTDIRMPDMSGFDLVSVMREERLAKAFIILSAYREFSYAHQALVEGALYYLIKPLDAREVEKAARLLYDFLEKLEEDTPAILMPPLVDPGNPQSVETLLASGFLEEAAPYENCYVWLGESASELPRTGGLHSTAIEIKGQGEAYLVSCALPLDIDDVHQDGVAVSLADDSFVNLAALIQSAQLARDFGFRFAQNKVVAQIQAYLAQHFSDHIVIRDLARVFFLSEVYLSELFKKYTGSTVMGFLKEIRLHRALDLLRGTQLSIKEISRMVGYDDPSYFGRLFKKEMNTSPEAYRKE
ncbi:helix-turn-helix domain-containing protein [Eubacteriales bacterium OttesenSCG-928-A19]|nr:helix-turn-helix domain-containing protein [Eubacteriales bacterium OttesenSCG-928-A19]